MDSLFGRSYLFVESGGRIFTDTCILGLLLFGVVSCGLTESRVKGSRELMKRFVIFQERLVLGSS